MILGKVVGTVVSTVQHAFYGGRRLLLVERCDADFTASGGYLIAVDTVQAGISDRVLVLDEGTGARQVLAADGAPVRSVIVGIVDQVSGG